MESQVYHHDACNVTLPKVRLILCKGPSTLTETETEDEVLLLILLSLTT